MNMFHWCNNNSDNPLEPVLKKQQLSDQNPISPSPFLSNFPSPFLDQHQLPLNQIILPHHNMDQTAHNSSDSTCKTKTPKCSNSLASSRRNKSSVGVAKKMRSGKKDRHSKICTAQGIRDRRMRLSLQVARKFFDLQDMLGYDKASNTIEWLFSKSKKAINDLVSNNNNNNNNNNHNPQTNINFSISDAKSDQSLLSECEVVSGIEENFSNNEIKEVNNGPSPFRARSCGTKKSRKTACKPNTRESREKARARARCRTREKMMIRGLENLSQWCKVSPNNENIDVDEKLGSSINNNNNYYSPSESCGIEYPDVGTIEKLLGIDPNTNLMGFLGNWDLLMNNNNNNELLQSANYSAAAAVQDFPLMFHH